MIHPTPALAALDAADARTVVHRRTYHEALDMVLALWEEARALNQHLGDDWRDDVASDIEMARVLNTPGPVALPAPAPARTAVPPNAGA